VLVVGDAAGGGGGGGGGGAVATFVSAVVLWCVCRCGLLVSPLPALLHILPSCVISLSRSLVLALSPWMPPWLPLVLSHDGVSVVAVLIHANCVSVRIHTEGVIALVGERLQVIVAPRAAVLVPSALCVVLVQLRNPVV
jgi:hypothetical protein